METLKQRLPVVNRFRILVKHDAIDEGWWSSWEADRSTILPEFSYSRVGLVSITRLVNVKNVLRWDLEESSHGSCPLSLKVVFAHIRSGNNIIEIGEAICGILVNKWAITLILCAHVLEIWGHLSHLERVQVVWKHKRRNSDIQILLIGETILRWWLSE